MPESNISNLFGPGDPFCSLLNDLIGTTPEMHNQQKRCRTADTNAVLDRTKAKLAAKTREAKSGVAGPGGDDPAGADNNGVSAKGLAFKAAGSWLDRARGDSRGCYPVGSII